MPVRLSLAASTRAMDVCQVKTADEANWRKQFEDDRK